MEFVEANDVFHMETKSASLECLVFVVMNLIIHCC